MPKYTSHVALKRNQRWWDSDESELRTAIDYAVKVTTKYSDKVTLRGAYLTQGFRADTDVLLWMHADNYEDIQDYQLELRERPFGHLMDESWAFAGITLEAEFNKAHIPAFVRGVAPKPFLCFYPFIRTPEWYLLPAEDRRDMLKEHGEFGREFPAVRTNNVSAFGLGDYEWVLSFESDDLETLVRMVRRQREAGARSYTKHEWPFIVGRRIELFEALGQLAR